MHLPYAYTPQIWPPILMAVLMTTLSVYSWRRRSVPGAIPLMIASLLAAAWAAASFLEYMAVDLPVKIAWFKVQAAVQAPIVTAITGFILEYAWPGRWLTRRNLALLAFPSLLAVAMVLTDDLHHLAWSSFSLIDGAIQPQTELGSRILLAYAFGVLVFVDLLVFGWLFWRSPQHRWPVVLMLAGQLSGRLIFLLERAHLVQSPLPLDLIGMSLEYSIYAVVLFGFRILDPMPLARRTVVQQLQTGMLVLDPQGRVVSLNPAAQSILGKSEKHAVKHSIQELLPAYDGLIRAAGRGLAEISLPEMHRDSAGTGLAARNYQVEISPLKDWRGLEIGQLLLLQDITEQKRAQAQLLEQQQALATLHERERLARELHDGIGQVLGFVKMQAQAARDGLAQDQKATVDSQLAQLISVAQDAHADVREYILGAKTAVASQPGFLPALCQYLRRFSEQYELRAELVEPLDWSDGILEATVEAQLLRVIQEAMTNARKHARARCIQVMIQLDGNRVRVIIQDDGMGFDPDLLATAEGQKYGLGFMRERAEEVGGSVLLQSAPGEGTRVVVEVPVKRRSQYEGTTRR